MTYNTLLRTFAGFGAWSTIFSVVFSFIMGRGKKTLPTQISEKDLIWFFCYRFDWMFEKCQSYWMKSFSWILFYSLNDVTNFMKIIIMCTSKIVIMCSQFSFNLLQEQVQIHSSKSISSQWVLPIYCRRRVKKDESTFFSLQILYNISSSL